MNNIIWQGRCSLLVYLYPYLFLALCSVALFPIHPLLSALGLTLIAGFALDAHSTRYTLTDSNIVVSGGLFGSEPATIELKDIVNIYVIDDVPWHTFSVGWILLVINEDDDEHPCLRCVRQPLKVGALIEQAAIEAGATISTSSHDTE
ncbi:hypothetical protein QWI17_18935 [Gilvimarinus sp. SDUM040013]|uniref:GPI-GlcNAc transferase complex PIG-H component conserved domain-containing protein n=1 Tax=Gilvimarinus gilvus TaxID=3058038 RepID=A0ABU4RUZ5_9GAMM|nr:hypothetical protein [Gilvimarinus sp. SDUM040013]MDO3387928.1 hypothetical protein [Gilvimarinus sp. SDUM040013]MDX6848701.1 hypothetical protein [Gilvimarinus sp. SDUM040013]